MPANPPTKPPEPPPAKPVENEFDRFHPDMPKIPGVKMDSGHAASGLGSVPPQLLQIGGIALAILFVGAILYWRVISKSHAPAAAVTDSAVVDQPAPSPEASIPAPAVHDNPNVAATADELSKPWDSKKFVFLNKLTQENIDAMVIRVPGAGLWAFSLQSPFSRCELDYVTDLAVLASQYRYNASHPMVVSPCDGTVFDPMKVGPLGANTWARGEIVRGSSLRPPISIDVKVSGNSIIADRIE